MKTPPRALSSFAPVAALVGFGLIVPLTSCVSRSEPRYGYSRSPQIVVQDAYVYYPAYEVYYNDARHQYVYRDGNIWVTRSDPPRAWAGQLRQAPSVRLDFHDAPDHHHAEVVRTYPRNWKAHNAKSNRKKSRNHDQDRDRDDRGRQN